MHRYRITTVIEKAPSFERLILNLNRAKNGTALHATGREDLEIPYFVFDIGLSRHDYHQVLSQIQLFLVDEVRPTRAWSEADLHQWNLRFIFSTRHAAVLWRLLFLEWELVDLPFDSSSFPRQSPISMTLHCGSEALDPHAVLQRFLR